MWHYAMGVYVRPSELIDWGAHKFMRLDSVGWTEEQFYDWWFNNYMIYALATVIPGSHDALRKIGADHRLILVTSQPTLMARRMALDFVDKYFPDMFEAMYFGPDKSVVELDVLIDDGPHNLSPSQHAPRKILFDQPWNRSYESLLIFRAYGWIGVLKYFAL